MVRQEHQVTGLEGTVNAAAGVGEEQRLDAQEFQHIHGVGDLAHGKALVVVEAALKGGYRLPRQAADDQVPGVARHSGAGEMGDVGIGEDGFILHGIHQAAQAAAQDHTAGGPQGAVGENVVGGALNGFVEIGHEWASFD